MSMTPLKIFDEDELVIFFFFARNRVGGNVYVHIAWIFVICPFKGVSCLFSFLRKDLQCQENR